ncbi:hypothetical protein [Massilia sp. TN1-12]|uniref:hypothetical protein n=1 Tax=Massilia paldalensis TaxID=3377675 RepID=UPI00384AB5E3
MQGIEDHSATRAPLARDVVRIVLGTALLLLVPLVAMRFTREVDWGPGDFLAAGALLAGAGIAWVGVSRRVRAPGRRVLMKTGVALVLLLVWAELAVGIVS